MPDFLAGVSRQSAVPRSPSVTKELSPQPCLFVGSVTRHTIADMVDAVEPKVAATSVAQEYVAAFNARDLERSRAVLNYPSVRLASGQVRMWERPEDYSIPWDLLAEREGWHHSTLDSVEVIQAGADKVHVAASFSRYDASGVKYVTHDALWVITLVDGHWGIQCRSSYAP
jgi:hypothetical protein